MNNNTKPIIMYDDDVVAHKTTTTGWVSRNGNFYGDNEQLARYDGCTHKKCPKCGAIMEKMYMSCIDCRTKQYTAIWESFPEEEWNEQVPITIHMDDKYFFTRDDLDDYLYDNNLELSDLQLVICSPVYFQPLDPSEVYIDILPEDGDIPEEIDRAFRDLNEAIREYKQPACWVPGRKKAIVMEW